MILRLKRFALKEEYTIGKIFVNDNYYCDTLEDKVRDLNKDGINETKEFGKQAIPYGTYPIKLRMSPSFKRIMPYLENIKGFQGVMIHSGNTSKDTLGCILVGQNKVKGKVINSQKTFKSLFEILELANASKEEIKIEII